MWIVASDFDRTLSHESDSFVIRNDVVEKINNFCSIYKFFVVTGREERYMRILAPGLRPTGWVLENGALLLLGDRKVVNAPETWFETRKIVGEKLTSHGISHSFGEVIIYVNSWNGSLDLGPGVRIERNRQDTMILPDNVNKGTGLMRAIQEMKLSGKVIAVGDAENDESLFRVAHIKVAVANAIPSIKRIADIVMQKEDGEGVVELLDMILTGHFPENIDVN
ncbi:Phosphoglycolate phosphatase [Metallosphaera sp. J1]|uniref:phosphoglycolate phosphatase n=1 Tax=Metallosphaera javensis (ex Hofmann et al. 2022) TaxID=99938 RepID=UPI001EE01E52|nr:phosphoglycolate phosphatase [Metallosphaera javensis (ex Hofmann et al. 2022)]MCG3108499.1 Phosphoglycolate phosphatase [Metallosphaera javensis (ex Hofmann et al. 2022)]